MPGAAGGCELWAKSFPRRNTSAVQCISIKTCFRLPPFEDETRCEDTQGAPCPGESKKAAREKAKVVIAELRGMKLKVGGEEGGGRH